nr:hypothetical protein [Leisingera aquaemixtae]
MAVNNEIMIGPAAQEVIAFSADQKIFSILAEQTVITCVAVQNVSAVLGKYGVVTRRAGQVIVAFGRVSGGVALDFIIIVFHRQGRTANGQANPKQDQKFHVINPVAAWKVAFCNSARVGALCQT